MVAGVVTVFSLSAGFFLPPKLNDDNDRGKRERNAGVEGGAGWGCRIVGGD